MTRRSSVGSSGTSCRDRYAKYGAVHSGSIRYTIVGSAGAAGSSAASGASLVVLGATLRGSTVLGGAGEMVLTLTDRSKISSKKTPGGMGAHVDPMLASVSASSLLARPT